MEKIKNLYRKVVAKTIIGTNMVRNSVQNVIAGDAGISETVVTVIIMLAGVVCAIVVYKGAKGLVNTTNSTLNNHANTLISDMA